MTDKLSLNTSLIHLVALGITVASLIVGGTLWASDIRSEMRVRAAEHDARIASLEGKMTRVAADHDVLIEIRTDLRQLRVTLERPEATKER